MGTDVSILGADALRQIREQIAAQDAAKQPVENARRKNKFGAVRTPYRSPNGIERIYDSKAEAAHAAMLDQAVKTGLALWWTCQVPFRLPGNKSYRADFVVAWADGRVSVQDVKGKDTAMSKLKRDQVKALYGIDVEIVGRG